MLYKVLETAINARETNGLAEKIEKLYEAGKITESQRDELIAKIEKCVSS